MGWRSIRAIAGRRWWRSCTSSAGWPGGISHALRWGCRAAPTWGSRSSSRPQAAVDRADDDEARGWLLNNLGALHGMRRDFPRAREHLERALAIKERTLGPEHVDVGISSYNLGVALADHGHYGEALDAFDHASMVYERTVGTDHPLELSTMVGRCWVAEELGEHARAEKICTAALAGLEMLPAWPHLRGRAHYFLAFALQGLGRDPEAIEHARVALEVLGDAVPELSSQISAWLDSSVKAHRDAETANVP